LARYEKDLYYFPVKTLRAAQFFEAANGKKNRGFRSAAEGCNRSDQKRELTTDFADTRG